MRWGLSEYDTDKSALMVVLPKVLLGPSKQIEFLTDFIETPTRYIVINQDKCPGDLGCNN